MAGGPLAPYSALPLTEGKAWPGVYSGAGTTDDSETMCFVADATTITSDHKLWLLKFAMPEVLPTGTAKLRILLRANATTGVCALNVKWASIALTESPDDATLSDEGSVDITVPATADQYKETLTILNADTVVAGENVTVLIEADDTAHTVAADCGLVFDIIWE